MSDIANNQKNTIIIEDSSSGDDLTITAAGAAKVDGSAVTQPITFSLSDTATLSSVTGSATSVTLLSANSSRLGFSVFNDSNRSLFIKMGTTASLTSYSVFLDSDEFYEQLNGYTGRIDGIWDGAAGDARITEYT